MYQWYSVACLFLSVSVPVVFVVLSNMSEWLTPESNIGSIHTNVIDARPRREPVRRMINSDIVSASISRNRVKNLVEPVVFLMEHRQVGVHHQMRSPGVDSNILSVCYATHSPPTHAVQGWISQTFLASLSHNSVSALFTAVWPMYLHTVV